jgi:hypothetical protein
MRKAVRDDGRFKSDDGFIEMECYRNLVADPEFHTMKMAAGAVGDGWLKKT